MSDLIIIGYDDHDTAAYAKVIELQRDHVVEALRPFGGEVLQTSLSHAQEKELAEELGVA
ncbi:DUF1269 domain-containing protein [Cryptosporangium minutisporangium]|uniref:Uncharacterized protein n=1 Tax=Cryptosporangium minutisporangium TaxID=113569 RepID=A0ABP6SU58_9ACTN